MYCIVLHCIAFECIALHYDSIVLNGSRNGRTPKPHKSLPYHIALQRRAQRGLERGARTAGDTT